MKTFKRAVWAVIAVQIVLLIYVAVSFQADDVTLVKGEAARLNTGWTLYREDGESFAITLPYRATSRAYETIVIENTIPRELAGLSMRFLTLNKQIKVFLDGEEIYRFGANDIKGFSNTPGSVTNYVDIPQDMGEGKIKIEMISPYANYASYISTVEIGERDVMMLRYIARAIPAMVLNMSILFSALTLGAVILILVKGKGAQGGIRHLHCAGIVFFIYFTIESRILRAVYGNQTFYSVMLFFCLMLLPMLFMLYFEANAGKKHEKMMRTVFIVTLANAVIQIALQLFNIMNLIDMAIVSYALLLTSAACGIIMYADRIKTQGLKWKEPAAAIAAIVLFIAGFVADLLRAFVARGEAFGKYSRVGVTIFFIIMLYIHVMRISRMFAANAEKAAERIQSEKEKIEEQNRQLLLARHDAEAARQEAQDASTAKSSFLASMSHEIRTPINAILGMDTMILRESREENIREYAKDIQGAGQNLLSLINDILDFSKIESGKMEIKPTDYELAALLGDCYSMIQIRAKDKGLFFRMENSMSIPNLLHGDEVRVRQIIVNLLTNAVKYTEKGDVVLSAGWERINDESIRLIVSVSDTGIGIKYEDQQRLFDSFQRLDMERNKNIEGTGLGLSITKQLVELMSGNIRVESSYGRGSTFIAEIPQSVRSWEAIGDFQARMQDGAGGSNEYRSGFTAPNARVLVVDDVPMNLKVIRELIKSTQIKIDTAESGKECLRDITLKKYDIIFLDHMMPEMDGIETLKNMQWIADNKNSGTPVIMLTANAIIGAKDEYIAAGFDDYLAKPVKESELEFMIRKYLPDELVIEADSEDILYEAGIKAGHDDKPQPQKAQLLGAQKESGNDKKPATDNRSLMEKLDFVDARAGVGYCAGSEAIYSEVLKSYAAGKLRDEIAEHYQKEDWKQYCIKVHALKSTSLNVGAVELSELAKALETAARNNDIPYIKSQHDSTMKEYDELLEKLRAALDN